MNGLLTGSIGMHLNAEFSLNSNPFNSVDSNFKWEAHITGILKKQTLSFILRSFQSMKVKVF